VELPGGYVDGDEDDDVVVVVGTISEMTWTRDEKFVARSWWGKYGIMARTALKNAKRTSIYV
jgi:hypothetical protein